MVLWLTFKLPVPSGYVIILNYGGACILPRLPNYKIIKDLGIEGSDIILESLWRHKKIESDLTSWVSVARKGPSIVEHRWKAMFPDEFKILDLINQMNLTYKDAKYMLPQIHTKNFESIAELPSVLF